MTTTDAALKHMVLEALAAIEKQMLDSAHEEIFQTNAFIEQRNVLEAQLHRGRAEGFNAAAEMLSYMRKEVL